LQPGLGKDGRIIEVLTLERASFRRIPCQLPDRPADGKLFGREQPLARLMGWLRRHTLMWLFERSVRTLDETERTVIKVVGILAYAESPCLGSRPLRQASAAVAGRINGQRCRLSRLARRIVC
jgi:hypothetical protein